MCSTLRGKCVLIADDDAGVRTYLSAVMKGAGATILEAEDGESTLEVLARGRADLALLDVYMPGKGGMQVLREMSQGGPPIIMVSGQGSVPDAVEAMQLGAADYLTKPISPLELLRRAGLAMDDTSVPAPPVEQEVPCQSPATEVSHYRCPHCLGHALRRSTLRGIEPLFLLAMRPFRCEECLKRSWRLWGTSLFSRAARLLRYAFLEYRWTNYSLLRHSKHAMYYGHCSDTERSAKAAKIDNTLKVS